MVALKTGQADMTWWEKSTDTPVDSDYVTNLLTDLIDKCQDGNRPTHLLVSDGIWKFYLRDVYRSRHWYWRLWWRCCDPFGWRG